MINFYIFTCLALWSCVVYSDQPADVTRDSILRAAIAAVVVQARQQEAQSHTAAALEVNETVPTDSKVDAIARGFNCTTRVGEALLAAMLAQPLGAGEAADAVRHERVKTISLFLQNPEMAAKVSRLLLKAKEIESDMLLLEMNKHVKNKHVKIPEPVSFFDKILAFPNNIAEKYPNAMTFVLLLFQMFELKLAVHGAYQIATQNVSADDMRQYILHNYSALAMQVGAYIMNWKVFAIEHRKLQFFSSIVDCFNELSALLADYNLSGLHQGAIPVSQQGRSLLPQYKKRLVAINAYDVSLVLSTVLSPTNLSLEKKLDFNGMLSCIAELDVYHACAKTIAESPQGTFCFAKPIDSAEKPRIAAKNQWSMLVPRDAVVPYTIDLDGKSMILTGPNAGGKTTAIRTLLQNILLAQSFGIAAAQSFEYTPYDVLHSYLRIADNVQQGASLFQEEVASAQRMVGVSRALANTNKKFFFAVDELFSGTRSDMGERCAYRFMRHFLQNRQLHGVYATHFASLNTLADAGSPTSNYTMAAPGKNAQGKFVYPYTLIYGENTAAIALNIAELAGIFGDAEDEPAQTLVE